MDMFGNALSIVTFVTALGCGLIAGVFFAFSSFVMKALGVLAPQEGIAAMQSVNIVVINPLFMTVFAGTALAAVVLMIAAFARWSHPSAIWLLLGAGLYLIGTFVVTIVCNVPMNTRLATLVASDPTSAVYWARYLVDWTFWNHVRAIAALAAMAAFVVAISSGR